MTYHGLSQYSIVFSWFTLYLPIVAIGRENMLRYLSADIICSEKRTVFWERSSRKTVSYEEQIMSKDKYPSIFSPQMEAFVFIILQIFFATRAPLKIGKYSRMFPSFRWEIFGHVTRLDQSRASEKIWWIIIRIINPVAKTQWSCNNPHQETQNHSFFRKVPL